MAPEETTMEAGWKEWKSEENLGRLECWARAGLTDRMIAEEKIGIPEGGFEAWKQACPEIRERLDRGRELADNEVENALLRSARGYTVTIREPVKVRRQVGGKCVEDSIEMVDKTIHVPASVPAQIFWLKNRRPNLWKERLDPRRDDRTVEKVNEAMRGYDELFRNPVPDRKQEDMQDTPLRLVHPDTQ